MKKQTILFMTVLALVGLAAGICSHIKNNRQLGAPGLKFAASPVFDVKGNVIAEETVELPGRVLDYISSTNLAITIEEVQALPPDTSFARRVYQSSDQFGLLLSIVTMGTDSRSIHKPEFCLPAQGWIIQESESLDIPIENPVRYQLPVKKITASKEIDLADGQKREIQCLYVYWFVAENELASEHFDRMWKMGKSLVTTGVLQRWSYVAVMAQCLPGQEEATYERMKEFIAASVPEFQITTGKPLATETASAEAQK